jgi:mono/diheme cytochrome c family protein
MMSRALRWLRNTLIGFVILLVVLSLVIYVVSERTLRRAYEVRPADLSVAPAAASVTEGFHIAQTRGCIGCHGSKLQGRMFIDQALIARVAAPNLTAAVAQFSDKQLAHIIRQGVRPDGRSVIIMPAGSYSQFTDHDIASVLAYLRSVPPVEGQRRMRHVGPLARIMFALGKFKPAALEAREADARAPSYPKTGEPHWQGAYIARTTCTECHGFTLEGNPGRSPDLRIASGYTLEQFTHFMRTGKALGDRELRLMSDVARRRFSHFTDDEIAELHGYLVARAGK